MKGRGAPKISNPQPQHRRKPDDQQTTVGIPSRRTVHNSCRLCSCKYTHASKSAPGNQHTSPTYTCTCLGHNDESFVLRLSTHPRLSGGDEELPWVLHVNRSHPIWVLAAVQLPYGPTITPCNFVNLVRVHFHNLTMDGRRVSNVRTPFQIDGRRCPLLSVVSFTAVAIIKYNTGLELVRMGANTTININRATFQHVQSCLVLNDVQTQHVHCSNVTFDTVKCMVQVIEKGPAQEGGVAVAEVGMAMSTEGGMASVSVLGSEGWSGSGQPPTTPSGVPFADPQGSIGGGSGNTSTVGHTGNTSTTSHHCCRPAVPQPDGKNINRKTWNCLHNKNNHTQTHKTM